MALFRFLIWFLFLSATFSWAKVPDEQLIPLENRRVIDLTATLSGYEISSLEAISQEIEKTSGAQYVIVLINSTTPYTIEDYGVSLGQYWGLGTEKADNGVILLIATGDRKMRIEIGYGLEGVLPDAYCKRIIETQLKPAFRTGAFYEGINSASQTIKELIFKEPVTTDHFKNHKEEEKLDLTLWMFFFPVFLVALLGLRLKFGVLKGVIPGLIILFILLYAFTALSFSIIYTLVMSAFTLLSGSNTSSGGGHYHGGTYYGGSSFGRSSGGFSGGFSGGGGSFGGGGASGNW